MGFRLLFLTADFRSKGNERWVADFDNVFHEEFVEAKSMPFITSNGGNVIGSVRSAGGGGLTAGNVTYVTVFEAKAYVHFDLSKNTLMTILKAAEASPQPRVNVCDGYVWPLVSVGASRRTIASRGSQGEEDGAADERSRQAWL